MCKLGDRLGTNLVVHVADSPKTRLRGESCQYLSKGSILEAVVVKVDFFDNYVTNFLFVNLIILLRARSGITILLHRDAAEYLTHSMCHAVTQVLANDRENLVPCATKDWHS